MGDTTLRFDRQGTFVGMVDKELKGMRGAIGHFKTYYDKKGKEYNAWYTDKAFEFNDLSVDRKQIANIKEVTPARIFHLYPLVLSIPTLMNCFSFAIVPAILHVS
ncbi:hypothetical protein [[Flexibacter] sp. ATCC 35208]|uniref:hypothetical protein n=1 Tax=[Flexibacter] sp. ATCC 35208 TaxID=1936242 RepID=UPI0009D3922A|nr:hypothetical protein [[Flexibacter] sp. ATCC 35208]OMP74525.1 hypothetical protein BW716_34920 [[Flexibacter] sp. ATCC 35208]